ncbi:MAG: hypothetical protein Q8942_00495 [Bacillota bacterium]|nr:hypothetical protein [Bacillota bacterium]
MQPKKIKFIDGNEKTRFECKFNSLPLNERKIIEKSIELFNDSEPCIIHRSFAIKKLLLEVCDYFNEALPEGNGKIIYENIPPNIKELLRISDDVTKLQLEI